MFLNRIAGGVFLVVVAASVTVQAQQLPSVSLESGDWDCVSGTTIEGGIATLRGDAEAYARVTLSIPGKLVAGKRLRLGAEVRTSGLKARSPVSYASPKLKIGDPGGKALAASNFGTADRPAWERILVEAQIPEDHKRPVILELGLQMCDGTLEVRNVTLEETKPWRWRILDAGADQQASLTEPSASGVPLGKRRNVLFLAVDDLKPELNCYGATQIISPNLDRLAADGTLFTHAYCQQAVCSPSRTSLMTGLRPDSTQVYDLVTHFRDNVPDVVTLPEQFARHGYATMGMGKIYHGSLNDKRSWNMPTPKFGGRSYISQAVLADQARRRREGVEKGLKGTALYNYSAGPPVECVETPDNAYRDGALADAAGEALRTLAGQDKPFLLAVGFVKPHLPFNAPKRYWDMYDPAEISLASNPNAPQGAPSFATHSFGELRAYQGIPQKGPLTEAQARRLIHGYYACVSFVDAQIGKVLDELDRLGLREETIVILWGDHGWHLGDHGLWCKHSNFESAARVPMIVRAPETSGAGRPCDALVEFVDVYPSLCELAGVPVPSHVEGTSFAPLLDEPRRAWKRAAFSQYPRGSVMGYSMRTGRYRYTEWIRTGGEIEAVELYDHENDPQENVNVAELPEYRELAQRLGKQLHQGWRAARP